MSRTVLRTAVFVFAAAVPAAAQPTTSAPTLTVNYYSLMFANAGEPVRKELKLTDEQTKKLAEHRVLTSRYSAARRGGEEKEQAAALKAIDKALADTLDASQAKRLRQITLQQLGGGAGFGRGMVARLPEVIAELKLTDDQRTRTAAGTPLEDVLTDAQKLTWKGMIGEKFETAISPFGVGGFPRVSLPANLRLLAEKAVQDELKLSDEQKAATADLQKPWQSITARGMGPVAAEQQAKVQDLARTTDAAITKLLNAGQQKRLGQIVLQQETNGGRDANVFAHAAVVKGLALTADQQAALKTATADGRKALLPLFLTGDPAEEIEKKVTAEKAATHDKLLAVLDPGQRSKLKDLVGEPFAGRGRGVGSFGGFGGAPIPTTALSVFVSGLQLADSKPLQDELKVTEVQAKRLAELRDKATARMREQIGTLSPPGDEWDKAIRRQAAENRKAVAEVLEPQQIARFQQIVVQYYATAVSGRLGNQVGRLIEVADALKLTKAQSERLAAGEELAKVLDEPQRTKWAELRGEPFANVASLRPSFASRTTLSNQRLLYLNEKSVRDELKLTAAQVERFPALEKKWQDLTRDQAAWRRGQDYLEKVKAANDAMNRELAEFLDAGQMTRLRQIDLQQVRKTGLGRLLTATAVSDDLGFAPDQAEKVRAISANAERTETMLSRELFRLDQRTIDEGYSQTSQAFAKLTDEKLMAVLTPQQKEKLTALLGPPFTGEIRRRGFGTFVPG